MSRGSKLAVIVSFVVLLVVATLLSDHLSRARNSPIEHGDVVGSVVGSAATLTPPPIRLQPLAPPTRDAPGVVEDPVVIAMGPAGSTGSDAADGPADANAGSGPAGVMGGVDDTGSPPLSGPSLAQHLRQLAMSASGTLDSVGIRPLAQPAGSTLDATDSRIAPRGGSNASSGSSPKSSPGSSPEPTVPTVYVVERGDTLFGIAESVYGKGELWRTIAEANPDKVDSRGRVRMGVRLTIPVRPGARNAPERPAAAPRSGPSGDAGAPRTYTVKRGDTLSEIARDELGTTKRMKEIIAMNAALIRDADDIRVGMVLKLPAR